MREESVESEKGLKKVQVGSDLRSQVDWPAHALTQEIKVRWGEKFSLSPCSV